MKVQDKHQIKPNTQSCQTSVMVSADITPEGLQALGDEGWKFKFGYNDNTELVFAREKRIINHFK